MGVYTCVILLFINISGGKMDKEYEKFIAENKEYDEQTIRKFAEKIGRDPGIVFGRLQKDGRILYTDTELGSRVRQKYVVTIKN